MDECAVPYSSDPVTVRMAHYASRHHGIVGTEELRGAGVARSTIERWIASGRLHRIHRGVYSVVPPMLLTSEGRWYAAVRACGPGAFLSHGPSGQLQGIVDRALRLALDVSHVGRRSAHPRGVLVHRPRRLEIRDTTTCRGIPTTTATRVVWDLAYTSPPASVRRAFREAERAGLLDRDRLLEFLDSSPSRRGSRVVRALLAERPLPLAEVRSWLEELLLTACADRGVPLPAVNVPVLDYEVDFLWPRERLVVEADGGDHLDLDRRDRDNARDIDLQRAGYLVRRYSSRDTRRAREVTAEILAILNERRPPSRRSPPTGSSPRRP
jgi:hypothetical protein